MVRFGGVDAPATEIRFVQQVRDPDAEAHAAQGVAPDGVFIRAADGTEVDATQPVNAVIEIQQQSQSGSTFLLGHELAHNLLDVLRRTGTLTEEMDAALAERFRGKDGAFDEEAFADAFGAELRDAFTTQEDARLNEPQGGKVRKILRTLAGAVRNWIYAVNAMAWRREAQAVADSAGSPQNVASVLEAFLRKEAGAAASGAQQDQGTGTAPTGNRSESPNSSAQGAKYHLPVQKGVVDAMEGLANGEPSVTLHNAEYGEIEYPIGKMGKGGMGFLHIVEQRMMKDGATLDDAIETAIRVAESAERGVLSREHVNTKHFDKDGIRAVVAFTDKGNPIITGYVISAEGKKGTYPDAPSAATPQPYARSEEVVAALKEKIAQLRSEEQAPKYHLPGYEWIGKRGRGWDAERGMSRNASSAYDEGRKPRDEWTREDFADAAMRLGNEGLASLIKSNRIPISLLRSRYLISLDGEWHHVGDAGTAKAFYALLGDREAFDERYGVPEGEDLVFMKEDFAERLLDWARFDKEENRLRREKDKAWKAYKEGKGTLEASNEAYLAWAKHANNPPKYHIPNPTERFSETGEGKRVVAEVLDALIETNPAFVFDRERAVDGEANASEGKKKQLDETLKRLDGIKAGLTAEQWQDVLGTAFEVSGRFDVLGETNGVISPVVRERMAGYLQDIVRNRATMLGRRAYMAGRNFAWRRAREEHGEVLRSLSEKRAKERKGLREDISRLEGDLRDIGREYRELETQAEGLQARVNYLSDVIDALNADKADLRERMREAVRAERVRQARKDAVRREVGVTSKQLKDVEQVKLAYSDTDIETAAGEMVKRATSRVGRLRILGRDALHLLGRYGASPFGGLRGANPWSRRAVTPLSGMRLKRGAGDL